ncbi:hypothetical protein H696_00534 [Fonticula alba]|uniref:NADP-dependent oxidoreductase domain-containing protein n=1 Tax=Fonticula alba TaxID=691883 RepID=A0A058ZHN1_FONAL|nr:hypothetical protein H696_00534 [Fonticula alba]KCV72982.1 hypothetical protein H696_00534 [Fonticula alba]|eukprot:XP_009492683.1 hypothetical protein H696_00534 [Fonticula alba]
MPGSTPMIYRHLGKTGLKVSVLSFGTWLTFNSKTPEDTSYKFMVSAFKRGINFFDCAEVYSRGEAETLVGRAVNRGIAEGVWHRSDLVLSTKIFFGTRPGPNNIGLSRKHIIEGTRESLARMQQDYVDLLFCHRPDVATPLEETVRAMSFCVDQGLAFYWGTSEWSAEQIAEAQCLADRLNLHPPVVEQPEYNLLKRQKVELDYLARYESRPGLGLTVWSPLASGVLTNKYAGGHIPEGSRLAAPENAYLRERYITSPEAVENLAKVERLATLAKELGISCSQLALAWVIANPRVSTLITGATSEEQLNENLSALDNLKLLTPEVMAKIDEIFANKPQYPQSEAKVIAMRR